VQTVGYPGRILRISSPSNVIRFRFALLKLNLTLIITLTLIVTLILLNPTIWR